MARQEKRALPGLSASRPAASCPWFVCWRLSSPFQLDQVSPAGLNPYDVSGNCQKKEDNAQDDSNAE